MGWLWYLGTLVPVIGLVQVGLTSRADRFTYLTEIGLGIGLAWGVTDLCRFWSHRRWLCGMTSSLVLVILMECAWRQTFFLVQQRSAWTHTLACTSQNSVAHGSLGLVLANRGQFGEATTHYRKAIKIKANFAQTHNNLAWLQATCPEATLRNGVEAIKHAQHANQLTGGRLPDMLDTLAAAYAEAGRFPEAAATVPAQSPRTCHATEQAGLG